MRQAPRMFLAALAFALAIPGAAAAEQAATVVITTPRPAPPRTVELPGSFEPYEDALLFARVTGYVARVHVDIGQRVKAGTPLVQLDIPEMQSTLVRARADVRAAEAALELADAQIGRDRTTHERLAELQAREPRAVTQQDVDMAAADLQVSQAAAHSAEARIAVSLAKLEELKTLMTYATISAPFDSVVTQRLVDPGALVVAGADGGKPVLEVVREDRLRLVLAVPESIVNQVHEGVPALIAVDALPGQTVTGTISRYAGTLSRDTRTMRAEIDIDHHGGLLKPGMYATVQLLLDSGSDQLSVPASLVHHDGNGDPFLWTVRDGAVAKTPIQIARDDGAYTVIRSGIGPETEIVLEGPTGIHEGQPVQVASGLSEEQR